MFGDDGIVVAYNDGHSEVLRRNQFKQFDPSGRLVEDRRANAADRGRLNAIASSIRTRPAAGVSTVVTINSGQAEIWVFDSRGWTEFLSPDHYILQDPDGNTVTNRKPRGRDLSRIKSMIGG